MLAKKEGKYVEALEYYKTAMRIGKHFFGNAHPSIGMYLTNLGDIHRKQGNFSMAENIYAQAITTLETALGELCYAPHLFLENTSPITEFFYYGLLCHFPYSP